MDHVTLKRTIEALVFGTINYAGQIYLRNHSVQVTIQKIINMAARLVLNENIQANVEKMLKTLYWLNSTNMYRMQMCSTLYTLLRTRCSPITFDGIRRSKHHEHHTRRQDLQLIWRRISRYARITYVVSATRVYNDLMFNSRIFDDYNHYKSVSKYEIFVKYGNGNVTK